MSHIQNLPGGMCLLSFRTSMTRMRHNFGKLAFTNGLGQYDLFNLFNCRTDIRGVGWSIENVGLHRDGAETCDTWRVPCTDGWRSLCFKINDAYASYVYAYMVVEVSNSCEAPCSDEAYAYSQVFGMSVDSDADMTHMRHNFTRARHMPFKMYQKRVLLKLTFLGVFWRFWMGSYGRLRIRIVQHPP